MRSELAAAFGIQQRDPIDDAQACQVRSLAAPDVGRVAVKLQLQRRTTAMVADPFDIRDRRRLAQTLVSGAACLVSA